MNLVTVLAVVAATLGIAQQVPYVISTLRGITKPSRVAAGISTVCNVVTVISMLATGASLVAVIMPMIFIGTNIVTLALAFKYGDAQFGKSELANALIALGAIAAWIVMGPQAAIIGVSVARVSSTTAIFRKLYRNPGTEDLLSWSLSEVGAVFSMAAILAAGVINFNVLAVPTISLLGCGIILALALVQRQREMQRTPAAVLEYRRQSHYYTPMVWLEEHHFPFVHSHTDFDLTA